MFELGEFEEQCHREIGKLINELNVNYFISIGKLAKITAEEINNLPKKSFDTIEAGARRSLFRKESFLTRKCFQAERLKV